jgi:hypothetical protein
MFVIQSQRTAHLRTYALMTRQRIRIVFQSTMLVKKAEMILGNNALIYHNVCGMERHVKLITVLHSLIEKSATKSKCVTTTISQRKPNPNVNATFARDSMEPNVVSITSASGPKGSFPNAL